VLVPSLSYPGCSLGLLSRILERKDLQLGINKLGLCAMVAGLRSGGQALPEDAWLCSTSRQDSLE
jgi:hypothetical protein